MILALVGLCLPVAAVWWVLRAARLRLPVESRALTLAVACGLGIGASSLVTFAAASFGWFPGRTFVAADAALWSVVGVLAWWLCRRAPVHARSIPAMRHPRPWTTADWLARVACVAVVAASFSVPVIEYLSSPDGQWDAWAIWNQKARFLFRAGDQWTASMIIPWSAPGHPILVSLGVARLWAYAGAELTAVPAMLSAVYGLTTLAVVMGALDVRRTRSWVAASVLVAPFAFSHLVAAQTADLPFAMFVVASLAMLRQDDPAAWRQHEGARSALFLSGVLAGLTAWTKNEGLVFLLASGCLASWVTVRHGRWRDMAWWISGVAPLAALVAYFKLVVAAVPPEYVAGATPAALVRQMLSADRHASVTALVWPMWTSWGGPMARWSLPLVMVAALALAVAPAGRSGRGVLAVVGTMLAGYYTVYVLTPLDLVWLVNTTFERLTMQVWPALVLAALSVGVPDAQTSSAVHAQGG